ncbi:MAG: putative motility protein [Pseudomonadota bacterium]
MDISGVSTGVVASAATNNGDSATVAVVKQTLDTESQTETQTTDAVSQPTKATEGNLGTKFDSSA